MSHHSIVFIILPQFLTLSPRAVGELLSSFESIFSVVNDSVDSQASQASSLNFLLPQARHFHSIPPNAQTLLLVKRGTFNP